MLPDAENQPSRRRRPSTLGSCGGSEGLVTSGGFGRRGGPGWLRQTGQRSAQVPRPSRLVQAPERRAALRAWMMGSRSPKKVCTSVTMPETKNKVHITARRTGVRSACTARRPEWDGAGSGAPCCRRCLLGRRACGQVVHRPAHRRDEQEGYEHSGAQHREVVLRVRQAGECQGR
jgi:hypothetical protein